MNCLKCGERIEHNQVFCPNCLAEMEQYPVRPDIVVQIPMEQKSKPKPAPQNAVHRQSMEEVEAKCRKLKKTNHVLLAVCVILMAATLVLSAMTFNLLDRWGFIVKLGQNYTTISETISDNPT